MVTAHEKSRNKEELRNKRVFADFTAEEFRRLKKSMRLRKYKKGQVLFDEGDKRDKVFYLIDGLVKLERYDQSAVYMYTSYVKKDKLFPYGELFSDDVYHYSAYALTDIELYYFSAELFEELLANNAKQLLYFYKRLSTILKEHEERIQFLVVSSGSSRVIKSLSLLMDELGEPENNAEIKVPYPITICEVATISGCSRETVGNKIRQLKEMGKLDHQHKLFTFKDIAFFRHYSED
ncbi:Crp/Fnr family transcriptional regulator [Pisciglobus halotolerans]|uniref:cAMP-binding domain of CRP or a regulatory subunit of cAMP-dependent protein kinases n=1 Tax=Pisciglobus halotolerans TaxID=745365 RepID=A0A1I3AQN9_9LACT|nr:Crp/Fnr family transcriptional regulator [Pisciglobus halotolerans]SFH52290.1 cAMP-binding domain of CRP or a regulatory subunit of cAMP-dependent protein kinases [Pisciglobus halotolerans]